jgi:hypothetical protein
MWGDKIDQFPVKEGDAVTVHFDIESREYNGRWYTDVKAWKIENRSSCNRCCRFTTTPRFCSGYATTAR